MDGALAIPRSRDAISETEALCHIRDWNARCDEIDPNVVLDRGRETPLRDEYGNIYNFKCPECGRRFVDADDGHRHERSHRASSQPRASTEFDNWKSGSDRAVVDHFPDW